jgi:3,4-dihydroxy 2-butanone 4-phosphate synthase/GTP cyclohydrolase II
MDIKPLLIELARGPFSTEFGDFTIAEFTDGKEHAIALFKGSIEGQVDILCRIHSECVSTAFYYTGCDCGVQMRNAERDIMREGKGIIIYLQQEGRGNGSAAHIATLELKAQGVEQNEAYKMRGFSEDKRNFEIAGKILRYFNVRSVRLETNNNAKISAMDKFGIAVKQEDYTNHVIELERIENLEAYAKAGLAKPIIIKGRPGKGKWVFILGDLNIDYKIALTENLTGNKILNKPQPETGGTAFNAAIKFKEIFEPVVFGKVGNDLGGRFIKERLEQERITALLGTSMTQATGICTMMYHDDERIIIKDDQIATNANDYDLTNLQKALAIAEINKEDYVFIVGHALTRCGIAHSKAVMEQVRATGAVIVFDLVPHNMHETISLAELVSVINIDKVEILVGEYNTFMGFLGNKFPKTISSVDDIKDDIKAIFRNIPVKLIDIRYGKGNISRRTICRRSDDRLSVSILVDEETSYAQFEALKKSGFGDVLTAELIDRYDHDEFLYPPIPPIQLSEDKKAQS